MSHDAIVRAFPGVSGNVAEAAIPDNGPSEGRSSPDGAQWVRDALVGRGVIDELTIGASDIDATTDSGTSGNSGKVLGPVKSIRVVSGSGSLVYVDDPTGTTRTLTGLAAGDELAPISCRTIKGTSHGSAALTLRVRW